MTVEAAAAMGFKREEAEQSLAFLAVMNRPNDFDVAMDLARFAGISLVDATHTLVLGGKYLRRLGFTPDRDVRTEVAGQAERYTQTIYGSLEVREAQGQTVSRVVMDALDRCSEDRLPDFSSLTARFPRADNRS